MLKRYICVFCEADRTTLGRFPITIKIGVRVASQDVINASSLNKGLDLQGSKSPFSPLTLLVIITTVLRYRL